MLVTLDTSHFEMSLLNEDAEQNMRSIFLTLDTSQLEISPLNLFDPGTNSSLNDWLISFTAETSQDPIGPCRPVKQSADSSRHSSMAAWSSVLEIGAHPLFRFPVKGCMGILARIIISRVMVKIRVPSKVS